MATKRTKSVGEAFYIQQAVKMCPYHCDIKERLIYIDSDISPECYPLSVEHLQTLGFKIQLGIPVASPRKEVFDPKLRLTARVVERARSEFLNEDAFSVGSSGEVLRITHIERGKIHLTYDAPLDTRLRQKAPLLVSEVQLKSALEREIWKRITDGKP